jgi:hypothetical protein
VRYRPYRIDNQKGTCEAGITAGQQGKGKFDMTGLILITAAGALAVGIIVGIVFMTTRGIKREQKRYEEARRFREEHGIWDDPNARGYFLPDEAPDGVSFAARRLNGLYVRHLPAVHGYDAELAA